MNFSNFSFIPGGLCMENGVYNPTCIYRNICGGISGHFRAWGIGFLVALVVIDWGVPLLFAYVLPKIKPLPNYSYMWGLEWQEGALRWLQRRLLWGFAVLTLYQIFL